MTHDALHFISNEKVVELFESLYEAIARPVPAVSDTDSGLVHVAHVLRVVGMLGMGRGSVVRAAWSTWTGNVSHVT